MPNPKNGEKLPALIVFGRFRSSNLNQAAVFLKKDAEAAKKAASDAGLSCLGGANRGTSTSRSRFARGHYQCAGTVLAIAGLARNNR